MGTKTTNKKRKISHNDTREHKRKRLSLRRIKITNNESIPVYLYIQNIPFPNRDKKLFKQNCKAKVSQLIGLEPTTLCCEFQKNRNAVFVKSKLNEPFGEVPMKKLKDNNNDLLYRNEQLKMKIKERTLQSNENLKKHKTSPKNITVFPSMEIPENIDPVLRNIFLNFRTEIVELRAENVELRAENVELKKKIVKLESDVKLLKEMFYLPQRQLIEMTRKKLWNDHADELFSVSKKEPEKGKWDEFYNRLLKEGYGVKYPFLEHMTEQFNILSDKIHGNSREFNKKLIRQSICELDDSNYERMYEYCFNEYIYHGNK